MEQFKIDHFKNEYPQKEFPRFQSLDNENLEIVRMNVANAFKMPPHLGSLEFAKQIDSKMEHIEGKNAANESFNLQAILSEKNITPLTNVYINWYRFDNVDLISFEALSEYFSNIWYPSADDIEIFDESMDWFLAIRHDGAVSLFTKQSPSASK